MTITGVMMTGGGTMTDGAMITIIIGGGGTETMTTTFRANVHGGVISMIFHRHLCHLYLLYHRRCRHRMQSACHPLECCRLACYQVCMVG